LRGNLDALKAFGPVHLLVFTREEDMPGLTRVFSDLEPEVARIEILFIDKQAMVENRPHKIMADMQRHAVARAIEERCALVWTYPDTVMPEGQYAALGTPRDLESREIGCILGQGATTRADRKIWQCRSFTDISILHSPKKFADILFAYEMLHPVSTARTVGPFTPNTSHPSMLYWRSPEGFVGHAFHLNPLICWPVATHLWSEGLDGDFTHRATFARPSVTVCDTFTMAEIAGPEKAEGISNRQRSPTEISAWAAFKATRMGIQHFKTQIRFGGCPPNDWAQIQADALCHKALTMQQRMEAA
jgi:hypothetical protein